MPLARNKAPTQDWGNLSHFEKWHRVRERHTGEAERQLASLGRVLPATRALLRLAEQVIAREGQRAGVSRAPVGGSASSPALA
jgi:hypothetical protein